MAYDGAIYLPTDWQVAYKAETALGTALTTSMQLLNVDDPVTIKPETDTIQTLEPRSGGAGRVLALADIYTSQKAQPTSFTVPFIADTTVLTPLLENVIGTATSTSPASIDLPYDYEPAELMNGGTPSGNLGAFTLALISPEADESIIVPGCVVESMTITLDMTNESGRMHASATFKTGYRPADGATAPTAPSAYGSTFRYFTSMTKKSIGGADQVLNKMELTFVNPLIISGFQGTYGEPEAYSRGPVKATGMFGVKYDSNTADLWEDYRKGTNIVVEVSDNATWTSATFGFKSSYGRLTAHPSNSGTDGGVFQELALEFAAHTSGDVLQLVP